ncbi:MAG: ATPase [Marinilabiliaceae bacterium]|nr:ATPase [Marinilabiliaceae bacterium]
MILIADSGSTSTQWCFLDNNSIVKSIDTPGINPYYQNKKDIYSLINNHLPNYNNSIETIYFYGAGCTNTEKNNIVKNALKTHYKNAEVNIASDLLAAARGLCGNNEGIACILGTGSNSCRYNGTEIVENVSPLGYILGDEGSGAVLGKKLIGNILKKQLPSEIINDFNNTYNLSTAEILDNVYKQPFPNRYLSRFTFFLKKHKNHSAIYSLISSEFQSFINRNILNYSNIKKLDIHFTGSIAFYFSDILKDSLTHFKLKNGKIESSPMQGLIEFHIKK